MSTVRALGVNAARVCLLDLRLQMPQLGGWVLQGAVLLVVKRCWMAESERSAPPPERKHVQEGKANSGI